MASNTALKEAPQERARPALSIPVFERELQINSLQAQRVMDRAFPRTVRALYSIDTILRIIGDEAEMDEVEDVITKLFTDAREALRGEAGRLEKLMENNGITETPAYTRPKSYTVQISSPQVAVFAGLVTELDALMTKMDACWLLSVLDNKQRKMGTFSWQQRMLRLGRRIVAIEERARKAAYRQGKGDEVAEALPPQPVDADDLADEDPVENAAPASRKKASTRKKAAATEEVAAEAEA